MTEIDYNYYSEIYMGTVIPEADFAFVKNRAEMILQHAIRGASLSELEPDKVNRAVCEVSDYLYESHGREGFLRESLDGYDVTYDKNRSGRELINIIRRYFGDDGVLYRGRYS
ncbi:MAG: hypothetical protein E7414_05850 [Ruminococcaceae bacterium]|nr:hypothetical protein [Oscillospiraceae bacterium]